MKTRECREGAAEDEEKHGDISSSRVDEDSMHLTSFDDLAEPLALPICRVDALVNKGVKAPKPCLSPVKMRTSPSASGLLPTGSAFVLLGASFPHSLFRGASLKRSGRGSSERQKISHSPSTTVSGIRR